MTILIESVTKTIFYDSEEAKKRAMKILESFDSSRWTLICNNFQHE